MGTLRYDHIDMLKGFTILWVILMHMDIGIPFLNASVQMPIFFLFAGCFFKYKIDFNEFFIKKLNSLIAPFVFFWAFSILFAFCRNEIFPNLHSLQNVSLMDLTDIFGKYSYLEVNILWFLFALIYMNLKFYIFYQLPYRDSTKNIIAIVYCLLSYVVGIYLFSRQIQIANFPLKEILTFQQYFIAGIIFGKFFINNYSKTFVTLSSILYVVFYFISEKGGCFSAIGMPIMAYTFCYLAVSIFFYTRNIKFNKLLEFFGTYSMVVYLTHMFLIHNSAVDNLLNNNILARGGCFLIIVIIEYFLILFFKSVFPYFIGKTPIFRVRKKLPQTN